MKNGIRLLGFLIMVYSAAFAFGSGIGPAGPEANTPWVLLSWLPIVLLVGGIGMMMLKKWSWYIAIIIMFCFTIENLYNGLMKYHKGNVGSFLRDTHIFFIFPLIVMAFLLIPKVKEQFR